MYKLKLILIATILFLTIGATAAIAEDLKVSVNGMVCAFCAQGIDKQVGSHESVDKVTVSLGDKLVTVSLKDGMELSDEEITDLIVKAGYEVVAIERS